MRRISSNSNNEVAMGYGVSHKFSWASKYGILNVIKWGGLGKPSLPNHIPRNTGGQQGGLGSGLRRIALLSHGAGNAKGYTKDT